MACAMAVASRSSSRTEPTGSDALRGLLLAERAKELRGVAGTAGRKASLPWSPPATDERTLPLIHDDGAGIRTILAWSSIRVHSEDALRTWRISARLKSWRLPSMTWLSLFRSCRDRVLSHANARS